MLVPMGVLMCGRRFVAKRLLVILFKVWFWVGSEGRAGMIVLACVGALFVVAWFVVLGSE